MADNPQSVEARRGNIRGDVGEKMFQDHFREMPMFNGAKAIVDLDAISRQAHKANNKIEAKAPGVDFLVIDEEAGIHWVQMKTLSGLPPEASPELVQKTYKQHISPSEDAGRAAKWLKNPEVASRILAQTEGVGFGDWWDLNQNKLRAGIQGSLEYPVPNDVFRQLTDAGMPVTELPYSAAAIEEQVNLEMNGTGMQRAESTGGVQAHWLDGVDLSGLDSELVKHLKGLSASAIAGLQLGERFSGFITSKDPKLRDLRQSIRQAAKTQAGKEAREKATLADLRRQAAEDRIPSPPRRIGQGGGGGGKGKGKGKGGKNRGGPGFGKR